MQVSTQQPVKAFDLLPVLEFKASSGKPTCISSAGNDIYVGYSTGHVRHFLLASCTSASGRTKYQVKYLDEMIGSSKRSVSILIVAPTIARIIGLAENSHLFVGDMFSMVGAQSYGRSAPKSVSFISVNESSSSYDLEIAVCINRKKTVQLMLVTAERFILKQEINNLQDIPHKLLWHGSVLVLAYESHYSVYNLMSRTELELFPYISSPLITTLQQEELYISADGLGMIINETGEVCRPPIAWGHQPDYVCYSNPYIIGVSSSHIQVYSLLDQQLKQKSGFTGACAVTHFSGRVYVVTEEQIYMLLPVPAEDQVERLLESGHLEQAMQLADETLGSMSRSTTMLNKLKRLRQRAAYMYWEQGLIEEAFTFFSKTQTPPLEVCLLYDTITEAPTKTSVSVAKLPSSTYLHYHSTLLRYIVKSGMRTEELNTQEYKLVLLVDQNRAASLLKRPMNMKEIIDFLKKQELHYQLGVYYAATGFISEAIYVWRGLEEGTLKDESYPGLACITELLLEHNIDGIIMDHIAWLVSRDKDQALRVVMGTTAQLNHDTIVELLSSPPHLISYLEHIVWEEKTQVNRHHTHLAQQYLSILLDQTTSQPHALKTRTNLQRLLLNSDKYAVSLILSKVEGTSLKKEQAILYGKLHEHEKALTVLVYEVGDMEGAEEYCREWPTGRHHLHLLLLKIYLTCETGDRDTFLARAVDLLNSKHSVFNYSEVYKIIPPHWPISLIQPFIYASLGAHHYRSTRVEKGLRELEWARVKAQYALCTRRTVRLTTGTYCAFCFHPFSDSSCSVMANGQVYHSHCHDNLVT